MRNEMKSRLQNVGSCMLGFIFGLGFSGSVVMSDAFGTKPAQKAANVSGGTKIPEASIMLVQEHVLETARAVPSAMPANHTAQLSPETIEMLQQLEPTARGEGAHAHSAPARSVPPAAALGAMAIAESGPLSNALENDRLGSPLYRLHLASVSKEENVKRTVDALKLQHADVLAGLRYTQQPTIANDARASFTRIYVGSFSQKVDAQMACAALEKGGQYCSVTQLTH